MTGVQTCALPISPEGPAEVTHHVNGPEGQCQHELQVGGCTVEEEAVEQRAAAPLLGPHQDQHQNVAHEPESAQGQLGASDQRAQRQCRAGLRHPTPGRPGLQGPQVGRVLSDPLPTELLGGCPNDASPSQFRGSTAPMARAMRQLPLADVIALGGAQGSAQVPSEDSGRAARSTCAR